MSCCAISRVVSWKGFQRVKNWGPGFESFPGIPAQYAVEIYDKADARTGGTGTVLCFGSTLDEAFEEAECYLAKAKEGGAG